MRVIIIQFFLEEEEKRQGLWDTPLNMLTQYVLPNLFCQTSQAYACFIEYLPKAVSSVQSYAKETSGHPVIWTQQDGLRYHSGAFKYRKVLELEEAYINQLNLSETDSIMFVRWPVHALYSLNLIQYLLKYRVTEKVKVLRFNKGYKLENQKLVKLSLQEEFEGFAYICAPQEYKNYFKTYRNVMGFEYPLFDEFPQEVISKVRYLLLTEELASKEVKGFIK